MGFATYVLTALTLVLVIEGMLYALFTRHVRAMMAIVLTMPEDKLRRIGFLMAAGGFILLFFLQQE